MSGNHQQSLTTFKKGQESGYTEEREKTIRGGGGGGGKEGENGRVCEWECNNNVGFSRPHRDVHFRHQFMKYIYTYTV